MTMMRTRIHEYLLTNAQHLFKGNTLYVHHMAPVSESSPRPPRPAPASWVLASLNLTFLWSVAWSCLFSLNSSERSLATSSPPLSLDLSLVVPGEEASTTWFPESSDNMLKGKVRMDGPALSTLGDRGELRRCPLPSLSSIYLRGPDACDATRRDAVRPCPLPAS